MKKFTDKLNESADSEKYDDVTEVISKMIESTIDNVGGEYDQFIESFLQDPENVSIEGLINESDINDFYIKYRNQIDKILNSIKFFQIEPDTINVFGLYDYIIIGTKKSIVEFVKLLVK